MAATWRNIQQRSTKLTELAVKHTSEYYKNLLEQNKHYIASEPTMEKCGELSRQLFYTRLASIPNRVESFWKEIDMIKHKFANRQELKMEEVGIAALFVGELYAWTCLGEIIGRRSLFEYKVYPF